jgi:hypothetical protein
MRLLLQSSIGWLTKDSMKQPRTHAAVALHSALLLFLPLLVL